MPFMVYEMADAVISSVSVGGGNGDKPVETMTVNYSKITWTFNAQKEGGGKEGEVKATWDVGANAAA
jgi:type VI secretion system secreted protein Hcp